ncbi:MAG: putative toxin-antitoxin system toxin component, PIN family [Microcystis sp.]|jgi:putative PIN family toxin of toxin-antitoxin system|uniref:putative toxin-antitoxin system toxin component, PIN family n=1 Tax=Microcystis TaxID=1125 RepID=UPI0016812484|nr:MULTISPECIES: putative toxin-antitoxin system toxin component, PIN family [Microcystis]NCQ91555.1 putative toxin-antitoxin system toxin component, PIN family [Microcystis aeruginosa LG13-13]NCR04730.1 putative toxin-antitoxin system toxin component, PIN family [Microcystis aeruginosa LG13-03]NCR62997.1 putative toxin-antitoxin system toxin component, PIN family [Microcystis aeruginosa LG11-05]NCR73948.1 putative toxin-antitoxin system toxin component, PIN family [Microcystis aeruginosa LG13-
MSLEYSFILDTNVLVSALLSKNGKARQALDKAQNIGKLLMSESTLLELITVFNRPKFDRYASSAKRRLLITAIKRTAEIVVIREKIKVCRDEKDNQYLELEIDGQATCIVSGDSDLLVLNPFREIPILTIQEFLDHDFSR